MMNPMDAPLIKCTFQIAVSYVDVVVMCAERSQPTDRGHALLMHFEADRAWGECRHFDDVLRPGITQRSNLCQKERARVDIGSK